MRWTEGERQRKDILAHLERFGPASGPELKRVTRCKQSIISALRRDKAIMFSRDDQQYHLAEEC